MATTIIVCVVFVYPFGQQMVCYTVLSVVLLAAYRLHLLTPRQTDRLPAVAMPGSVRDMPCHVLAHALPVPQAHPARVIYAAKAAYPNN